MRSFFSFRFWRSLEFIVLILVERSFLIVHNLDFETWYLREYGHNE